MPYGCQCRANNNFWNFLYVRDVRSRAGGVGLVSRAYVFYAHASRHAHVEKGGGKKVRNGVFKQVFVR